MEKIICAICGKEVPQTKYGSGRKYCSDICRKEANRERAREHKRKVTGEEYRPVRKTVPTYNIGKIGCPDDGVRELANAIVYSATADYRRELVKEKPNIKALERFFRGAWFGELTNIDPEWLMASIKRQIEEETKSDKGRTEGNTED